MSNSSLVSKRILTNNMDVGRGGQKIEKIVIHHMAGIMSIEQCGSVFKSRAASAHYGIGSDGRIGQYVDEANTAWACGSKYWNQRTISIELSNDTGASGGWHVSDKAIASCIKLVADICKRNNIRKIRYTGNTSGNLIMHRWIASTACPAAYVASKYPYIADEINKLIVKKTYGEIRKYKCVKIAHGYKDAAVASGRIGKDTAVGSVYSAVDWKGDFVQIPYLDNGWFPTHGSKGVYLERLSSIEYIVTNISGVNIYADRTTKSKFIKNIQRGAELTVTKWHGAWGFVSTKYGSGWVAMSCLLPKTKATELFRAMEIIAQTLKKLPMIYTTKNLSRTLDGAIKELEIDCAHYVSFGLQAIGRMPRGEYIWLDTSIHGNGASYITGHPEWFSISRPNKLPKDCNLQIGDICGYGYSGGQHTQVFAGWDGNGNPLWYSAGGSDVKSKNYGMKRKTPYENRKITYLIRLKG